MEATTAPITVGTRYRPVLHKVKKQGRKSDSIRFELMCTFLSRRQPPARQRHSQQLQEKGVPRQPLLMHLQKFGNTMER